MREVGVWAARPECVSSFETPVAGSLVSNAALPGYARRGFWKVDADLYRHSGWCRITPREAFGMCDERLIEHLLAGGVEPHVGISSVTGQGTASHPA